MKDTKTRLSHISITLHWLVGVFIMVLMGVGMYMSRNEVLSMYPTHKSIGMIVFAFILLRVIWRLINGWPEAVAEYKSWERQLSMIVHWVLIIGTLLFPISGMMMSGAGGHGLSIFGLELLAPNIVDGAPAPINAVLAGLGANVHGILGKVMMMAILLHIAGALKHHFLDKDGMLTRMLGKKI